MKINEHLTTLPHASHLLKHFTLLLSFAYGIGQMLETLTLSFAGRKFASSAAFQWEWVVGDINGYLSLSVPSKLRNPTAESLQRKTDAKVV